MDKIKVLIEEIPTLLTMQKEVYTVMISERKAKILDYRLEQSMKLDRQELKLEENQG